MARITSTPTSLTVSYLPSWLPAKGSWGQVSQPASSPGGRLDRTVAGDFPNTPFTSARNMGIGGFSDDYMGAVWNPYWGTYGAWVIHGGGHATNVGMVDNSVYIWDADTRLWARLSDPIYPGDLSVTDWSTNYESNARMPSSAEPLKSYGELTANHPVHGYAPAASHTRFLPCIVAPGKWGMGAKGGLAIPATSSYHWGSGYVSGQGHIFDFVTRKWSRLGDLDALRGSNACVDGNGNVYKRLSIGWMKLAEGVHKWTMFKSSTSHGFGPTAYDPVDNLLVHLDFNDFNTAVTLEIIDLDDVTPSIHSPGMSGMPSMSGSSSYGDIFLGLSWCGPRNGFGVYYPPTKSVYILRKPANPKTQPWKWDLQSSSNTPTTLSSGSNSLYYHRFQYSSALNAFFISYDVTRDGMWCFRPADAV